MNPHDPKNKKYFFSPSLRFIHLNKEEKLDLSLSLLTQLQLEAGYHFRWFAIFAGVTMNGYFYKKGLPLDTNFDIATGTHHQVWVGYVVGIQLL